MALPNCDSLDGCGSAPTPHPALKPVRASLQPPTAGRCSRARCLVGRCDGLPPPPARGALIASSLHACSAEATSIDLLRRFFYLWRMAVMASRLPDQMPVWDYISH